MFKRSSNSSRLSNKEHNATNGERHFINNVTLAQLESSLASTSKSNETPEKKKKKKLCTAWVDDFWPILSYI